MDSNILQTLEEYKNKFKEFESLKIELSAQKEEITKKLSVVDKNIIYLQGVIRGIQEATQTQDAIETNEVE